MCFSGKTITWSWMSIVCQGRIIGNLITAPLVASLAIPQVAPFQPLAILSIIRHRSGLQITEKFLPLLTSTTEELIQGWELIVDSKIRIQIRLKLFFFKLNSFSGFLSRLVAPKVAVLPRYRSPSGEERAAPVAPFAWWPPRRPRWSWPQGWRPRLSSTSSGSSLEVVSCGEKRSAIIGSSNLCFTVLCMKLEYNIERKIELSPNWNCHIVYCTTTVSFN